MKSSDKNKKTQNNSGCCCDKIEFISIQIERYLTRKTVKRFCSAPEKDVVLSIIEEAWKSFLEEFNLSQKDTVEKRKLFYGSTIIFPYFVAEEESYICVDFKKQREYCVDDVCFCGSGRPYYECCGDVKLLYELDGGYI